MNKEWSEGRLRGFIVSLLRSGMRKYPPKWETMGKAYVGIKQNQATGRKAKHFECNGCGGHFPQKDVNVDHIESVIDPATGFVDWDTYIKRLYCKADNLQVLCKGCHSIKSAAERKARAKVV